MQELDHEPGKSLERTWYSNGRTDLYEYSFGGVDVDLQLPGLVDRRIEESE